MTSFSALMLAVALIAPSVLTAQTAGLREGSLRASDHDGHKIDYVVWYPSDAKTNDFGGNAVWQPVQAAPNAAPIAGHYPVVLMSHGLGGHYKSLAWLASELAKSGAVVVAVNHPNSTVLDFNMQAGLAHWTRPADLIAALAEVQVDPEIGPLMDMSQLAVVGFSYGGWTALSMGGVRGSLAGYQAHCKNQPSSHCVDIAKSEADLALLDAELWDGNYLDTRVRKIVAIDPGLTYGLTTENVAGLAADTLLIQLGQGPDRLDSTDLSAKGSGFAALVADAKLLEIAPAYHFSAMPLCTAKGAVILASENDDPVCTDPKGADRSVIHDQMIAAVKAHLGLK